MNLVDNRQRPGPSVRHTTLPGLEPPPNLKGSRLEVVRRGPVASVENITSTTRIMQSIRSNPSGDLQHLSPASNVQGWSRDEHVQVITNKHPPAIEPKPIVTRLTSYPFSHRPRVVRKQLPRSESRQKGTTKITSRKLVPSQNNIPIFCVELPPLDFPPTTPTDRITLRR